MDEDRDYNANDENGDLDCDEDDVHDGDKEHEWDVKSRAFKSRRHLGCICSRSL